MFRSCRILLNKKIKLDPKNIQDIQNQATQIPDATVKPIPKGQENSNPKEINGPKGNSKLNDLLGAEPTRYGGKENEN